MNNNLEETAITTFMGVDVKKLTDSDMKAMSDYLYSQVEEARREITTKLERICEYHKDINLDLHGRPDCKSCSMLEGVEELLDSLEKRGEK